ncbi:MAG: ribonuclease Y [Patescibacteria group bacterium]|nr:ribonuclease Y [Patescibacteria group bacterium]
MNQLILLILGLFVLSIGTTLGYYARQSIARRNYKTLEAKIQKKVDKAQQESKTILEEAHEKAKRLIERTKGEENQRRGHILKTERVLLRRENILDNKISDFEKRENTLEQKVKELRKIKQTLERLKEESLEKIEKIAELSKEEAKKELLKETEKTYQNDLLEKIRKLEKEQDEEIDKKAKEIIALSIQRCAISQAQDITTSTVSLPSDEIKGRIIGKEGRNIRTLERLTGTEVIVDETPETVIISSFDPIRREIAKISLEKLIKDGRIQPARIEEVVQKSKEEVISQTKKAGEQAVYDTGFIGLNPKLIQILGRLRFRTSYGQNVLLHSIEVSHLAGMLASELGANVNVAKKAGLLHDVGKAIDHQVEGSHVDIGIKILEKFGIEKEVIDAMKSHHEEYPYESLEARIVQTADQISGARPGARKDTLEHYLKRLGELEAIATSFSGIDKAYAIQAGREIRVFVRPEEIDDLSAHKLARSIADKIEKELRYPGEIKVNVIRENRTIEYAR